VAVPDGLTDDLLVFPPWPCFDDTERAGVLRALEQGQWWRMTGGEVDAFEAEFAAYHGAPHALAVTNGTHAIELALQILGVGPGDEVIVPAFTFISTSLAVQRLGAVPVPVDVDPDTYCLDPAATRAAITDRTKAIMPVHMAGHLVDMDALAALADEVGVHLVQDAAHAHGGRWLGRRIGELGSVATLSFQNGKLMTAGEGGAVLLPDADLYEQAFLHHSCGRPRVDMVYDHRTPGSNFRMNEFSAAVLRAQLARLPQQTEVREARMKALDARLAEIPGVVPQGRDERCDVDPHYMAMFQLTGPASARRDEIVDALVERGIPAFRNYPPVYRTRGFWQGPHQDVTGEELARRCPQAEQISDRGIWLHHRVLLADEPMLERLCGWVGRFAA
jgi:3-amino-5-hydroxybenzoate synthase